MHLRLLGRRLLGAAAFAVALGFVANTAFAGTKGTVDGDTWYATGNDFPFDFGAVLDDGFDVFPDDFGADDGAFPLLSGTANQVIPGPGSTNVLASGVDLVYVPLFPNGVPATFEGNPVVLDSAAAPNGAFVEFQWKTSDGSPYSSADASPPQNFGTDIDMTGPGIRRGIFWIYWTLPNGAPLPEAAIAGIAGAFGLPYGPHPVYPDIPVLYATDNGEQFFNGKFGYELEDEIPNAVDLQGLLGLPVPISGFVAGTFLDLVGDMNADGAFDNEDISPFVLALIDPAAYSAAFPQVNTLNMILRGNADGVGEGTGAIDNEDIIPFVNILLGLPPGGAASAVPEPSTFVLAGLALVGGVAARRWSRR